MSIHTYGYMVCIIFNWWTQTDLHILYIYTWVCTFLVEDWFVGATIPKWPYFNSVGIFVHVCITYYFIQMLMLYTEVYCVGDTIFPFCIYMTKNILVTFIIHQSGLSFSTPAGVLRATTQCCSARPSG